MGRSSSLALPPAGMQCRAGEALQCPPSPVSASACKYVWGDSSLRARYARVKPHRRLRASATSSGFLTTRG